MTVKAVVGATVLDGTGREPVEDGVVVLDCERVSAVTGRAEANLPEDAEIVDATGRYVIPGLVDANVHLCSWVPDVLLEQQQDEYAGLVEEAAQVALRAGVTTAFDTWGPLDPLTAVRDRINSGEIPGTRIFRSGNILGLGGPLSTDFSSAGAMIGPQIVDRINRQWEQGVGQELLWLTPDEVRRRVRDYIQRSGIDFLKYAASGHAQFRRFVTFSERVQRVIVEEAHAAGLTAQAHTTTVESLHLEIEAGADLLQHPNLTGREPIPDETLKTIVDKGLPSAILVHTKANLAWVAEHGPAFYRTHIANDVMDENNRRLIEAGAKVLLTTDGLVVGPAVLEHPGWAPLVKDMVDIPFELGVAHFRWLEAVVAHGLAPMDALQAATRNVAEAYGQGDELGTLEPGKRADLVVLDGDPLADVTNYRRINRVIKDGAVVDRDALPLRPVLT